MNRRKFLATSAASIVPSFPSAVIGAAGKTAFAKESGMQVDAITVARPDGLNPPGIRTAGIRMVPVVKGKYKVWTKCMT